MDNDDAAEASTAEKPGAPSLPPRAVDPWQAADVWDGTEPEPELLHHPLHHEQTADHSLFLMPTTLARTLSSVGWIGGVVATVLLLQALLPAFRNGDTRNYVIDLDEATWFADTLVASSLLVYVGWMWWSISAAFNARRLVAMTMSPWLPTVVYCGGPLIIMMGADRADRASKAIALAGCACIAIGHLIVVASLRTTAGRIHASADEFSKLFWLPLAWVAYRMASLTFLTFLDDTWRPVWLLIALGAIGALFLLGLAGATWHATGTFDAACRRLNGRGHDPVLPSTELITAAIRRRMIEGR